MKKSINILEALEEYPKLESKVLAEKSMLSIRDINLKNFIEELIKELAPDENIKLDYGKFYKCTPGLISVTDKTIKISKRGIKLSLQCFYFYIINNTNLKISQIQLKKEQLLFYIKTTIAHEIGHYINHKDKQYSQWYNNSRITYVKNVRAKLKEKYEKTDEEKSIDSQINENCFNFKKIVINEEEKAWKIAKESLGKDSDYDEKIFNYHCESCLKTYKDASLEWYYMEDVMPEAKLDAEIEVINKIDKSHRKIDEIEKTLNKEFPEFIDELYDIIMRFKVILKYINRKDVECLVIKKLSDLSMDLDKFIEKLDKVLTSKDKYFNC